MRTRTLILAIVAAAALLGPVDSADAGNKRRQKKRAPDAVMPAELLAETGTIDAAAGNAALYSYDRAVVTVSGWATGDEHHYTFRLRARMRRQHSDPGTFKGTLRGMAWWVETVDGDSTIHKARLLGEIRGPIDRHESSTLTWSLVKGADWSGTIELSRASGIGELTSRFRGSLLHVAGDGGNDRLSTYGLTSVAEAIRQTPTDEHKRRRKIKLHRGPRRGQTGSYRGLFETRWQEFVTQPDGSIRKHKRAQIGVAEVAAPGEVVVLKPEARILRGGRNLELDVNGDSLEVRAIRGALPELREGNVLLSDMDGGVLGLVDSVEVDSDRSLVVELGPASISDVVGEGSLSLQTSQSGLRGEAKQVIVESNVRHRTSFGATRTVGSAPLRATISTTTTLDTGMSMYADLGWTGLKEFDLNGYVDIDTLVTVAVAASASDTATGQVKVFDSGPQQFWAAAWGVPVQGSTRWKLYLRAEIEMRAGASVTTGFNVRDRVRMSVTYERGQGWRPSAEFQHLQGYQSPVWESELPTGRLRVELVPVLEVQLYQAPGATLEPYAFGEVKAATVMVGRDVHMDWDVDVGLGLDATIFLRIFDRNLGEVRFRLVDEHAWDVASGRLLVWEAPPLQVPEPTPGAGGGSTGDGGSSGGSTGDGGSSGGSTGDGGSSGGSTGDGAPAAAPRVTVAPAATRPPVEVVPTTSRAAVASPRMGSRTGSTHATPTCSRGSSITPSRSRDSATCTTTLRSRRSRSRTTPGRVTSCSSGSGSPRRTRSRSSTRTSTATTRTSRQRLARRTPTPRIRSWRPTSRAPPPGSCGIESSAPARARSTSTSAGSTPTARTGRCGTSRRSTSTSATSDWTVSVRSRACASPPTTSAPRFACEPGRSRAGGSLALRRTDAVRPTRRGVGAEGSGMP